ncbi:hypothetical protein D3C80_1973950 [compost metagenome]
MVIGAFGTSILVSVAFVNLSRLIEEFDRKAMLITSIDAIMRIQRMRCPNLRFKALFIAAPSLFQRNREHELLAISFLEYCNF